MTENIEVSKDDERRIQLVEDYKALFGSTSGQNVLDDLILKNNVFERVFHEDPYKMAFNEGMRCAVLNILKLLDNNVVELRRNALKRAQDIYNERMNEQI